MKYTMQDMSIADALFTCGERTAIGWSDRADIAIALTTVRESGIREGRRQMREEVKEFIHRHANGTGSGWEKYREVLLSMAALLEFIPDDPPEGDER